MVDASDGVLQHPEEAINRLSVNVTLDVHLAELTPLGARPHALIPYARRS